MTDELAQQILKDLDLDPANTKKFSLHFEIGETPTLEATHLVHDQTKGTVSRWFTNWELQQTSSTQPKNPFPTNEHAKQLQKTLLDLKLKPKRSNPATWEPINKYRVTITGPTTGLYKYTLKYEARRGLDWIPATFLGAQVHSKAMTAKGARNKARRWIKQKQEELDAPVETITT